MSETPATPTPSSALVEQRQHEELPADDLLRVIDADVLPLIDLANEQREKPAAPATGSESGRTDAGSHRMSVSEKVAATNPTSTSPRSRPRRSRQSYGTILVAGYSRTCERRRSTHSSAARHAASASRRMASLCSPAAG